MMARCSKWEPYFQYICFCKNIPFMAALEMSATKFNPLQMHLLQLFAREMTEQELEEVKTLLVSYYDQKIQEEVSRIWIEKGMTNETMHQLLETHIRSPYK
jgi:hypothetical protein